MSFEIDRLAYTTYSASPSPPPTYYSTVMNTTRSYSPEFNHVDSPTYSFSSSSSHLSRPIEEHYVIKKEEIYPFALVKREVLSPLPDSFYDAYSHHLSTGLPLLTPPATTEYMNSYHHHPHHHHPYYNNGKKQIEDFDYQENNVMCCNPLPPPIPTSCYSPGCDCSLMPPSTTTTTTTNNSPNSVFYNNGMISPNPMFYDPLPFNMLPPPPPLPPVSNGRGYKRTANRHHSLDSTSSSSTEKSSNSSATPRRYKCTLCVKRFTRPSSLATHMHSHTGEKPYRCVVEGCGRRFSVVSNLRRHAKIHTHNP